MPEKQSPRSQENLTLSSDIGRGRKQAHNSSELEVGKAEVLCTSEPNECFELGAERSPLTLPPISSPKLKGGGGDVAAYLRFGFILLTIVWPSFKIWDSILKWADIIFTMSQVGYSICCRIMHVL